MVASVIIICAAIFATVAVATGVMAYVIRRRDLDRDQAANATRAEAATQLHVPEPRNRSRSQGPSTPTPWTGPRHRRP